MKKTKEVIQCDHFRWSLFRRGGVFYADGRVNKPNLGKHSLATRDVEEARENLRKLDRRKAVELQLISQEIADTEGMPIAEGWKQYLADAAQPLVLGGVSVTTQKRYRAVQDKHIPYCARAGTTNWSQVTRKHVANYGTYLHKEGYGDATIYMECTLLKQLVKWLIEERHALPQSARIHLSIRRSEDSSTYCFTQEQVEAMAAFCDQRPDLIWLRNVIIALAATGMRIGELMALRWNAVDMNAGVITVVDNRFSAKAKASGALVTTKGRRSRTIPIHPELLELLRELPRRPDGRVFGAQKGGILDPDKVLRTLQKVVIAGLKGRFPTPPSQIGFAHAVVHSFRHYFVSEAFMAGATEGEVMSWVGHGDSRIVRRYRHVRPSNGNSSLLKIAITKRAANGEEVARP
jgi:integrase